MIRRTWFIVGCLWALVSCTKKEEAVESNPTTPSTEIAPPVVPSAANPVVAEEDDSGLVTSADLEEKAVQAITEKNLDSQLDELEKEIGKSE
jgi:hypothetical protein